MQDIATPLDTTQQTSLALWSTEKAMVLDAVNAKERGHFYTRAECGAALIIVFSTVTSLVQLIVPDELRGRVMSIYMVAFRGGMPLGSLVGGYFASLFGAPAVLAVNGMLLVCVSMYFLIRSHGVREL